MVKIAYSDEKASLTDIKAVKTAIAAFLLKAEKESDGRMVLSVRHAVNGQTILISFQYDDMG